MTTRKLSLLGLVLMGASAVTAAVIPSSKDSNKKLADNGSLVPQSGNEIGGIGFSCKTEIDDNTFNCTATAGTNTTQPGDASNTTVDNTSLSGEGYPAGGTSEDQ